MEVTATEKLIKSQQSSGERERERRKKKKSLTGKESATESYEGCEDERAGERVKEIK